MSVRNANGIGLGGALRSPQIIGGLALAVAITIAAVALVSLESNDTNNTVAPPAASFPDAAGASTFNTVADALPSTVYIVTSEEAAETLRRAIVEGDNIRVNMGLSPSIDSVAVVANEAEAAHLEASINEANAILAGLGKPMVTVVRPQLEPAATNQASASTMTVEEIIAEHDNAIGAVLDQR